jgi:TatD DNase family protein
LVHSLVDTHSHIYAEQFDDDRDDVIERARTAGVNTIIVPATKPEEFERVAALVARYPGVRGAYGIHPHHAAEIDDGALARVEELAASGESIAVGEIGLDYYYDFAPRDRQQQVFRRQLRIARERGLPAILHNRESDDDLLTIIDEEQDGSLAFVLHCFSSGVDVLERALGLGAMVSFTGNVTFAKANLGEVVARVPDDRIMIETDAPYLAPVPHRGRRNEPSYVTLVADRIATIRGQTPERIRQMTTDNARRFFRLALLVLTLLTAAGGVVEAQTRRERPEDSTDSPLRGPRPAREVDTTRQAFTRIFGIGGHVGSSTYISEATTEGNGFAVGFWATAAPLAPLDVNFLHLDLIYTHVKVSGGVDSAFDAVRDRLGDSNAVPPPNIHNTVDIGLRFTANPSAIFNFFATIGMTHFSNEFGIDRYIIEHGGDTTLGGFEESAWGINGGIGIAVNLRVPYFTIAPTAELRVLRILGDRPLARRSGEFFVSQTRAGVIIYPDFNALFR